jgi:hypothetical protein
LRKEIALATFDAHVFDDDNSIVNFEYFCGEILDEIAYDRHDKPYQDLTLDEKMPIIKAAGDVITEQQYFEY